MNIFEYDPQKENNWTDPWVRVDKKIKASTIVKTYVPTKPDENTTEASTIENTGEQSRIDAIEIPVIKLNNIILEWSCIKEFHLYSEGFEPSLSLVIYDPANSISTDDIPGMKNKITVIISMPIDGAYGKISVDFYIINVDYIGNDIYYNAKLFNPALERKLTKFWTFKACNDDMCKLSDDDYPTTYELIHIIAEETGLGFAATDQVKEIADHKIRMCKKETYKDIIKKHIGFGGLDDNSIFDCWINLYGYITVVNLPWVFNSTITSDKLMIHQLVGTNITDTQTSTNNKLVYTELLPRTLTNYNELSKTTNMRIINYSNTVNNGSIINNGTSNTYYSINTVSGGGNNSMQNVKIKIVENSTTGERFQDDYTFEEFEFIGNELGNADDNCTPVLFQEKRRNAYLAKLYARTLSIELNSPNFGLMRGTLVNVIIYEYDRDTKLRLIAEEDYYKNLETVDFEHNKDNYRKLKSYDQMTKEERAVIDSNKIGLVNPLISGIYYINGVKFDYNIEDKKIKETLSLIKKDKIINYLDATLVKTNTN